MFVSLPWPMWRRISFLAQFTPQSYGGKGDGGSRDIGHRYKALGVPLA